MGKKDLSYWDEFQIGGYIDHKKKSKERKEKDYDYDNDDSTDPLPLSQEYLNHMADILDQFLHLVKTYFIYPDLSQEEYNLAKKRIKKAISRMRKGQTVDFDAERTMDAITNGDIPEKFIDGGY